MVKILKIGLLKVAGSSFLVISSKGLHLLYVLIYFIRHCATSYPHRKKKDEYLQVFNPFLPFFKRPNPCLEWFADAIHRLGSNGRNIYI